MLIMHGERFGVFGVVGAACASWRAPTRCVGDLPFVERINLLAGNADTRERAMDHATTEMVDGRGTGLEARTVRRYDNGPTWDGRKTTYDQFWYEMSTYIGTLGLGPTLAGTNRVKFESDDEEVKNAYDMLKLKLARADGFPGMG